MKQNIFDRLMVIVVTALVVVGVVYAVQEGFGPIDPARSYAQTQVQSTLVPRFINFDIGAMTLRSGAVFQENAGLPSLPPYVQLPNSGYPLMMANFTLPPDYASNGDITARMITI